MHEILRNPASANLKGCVDLAELAQREGGLDPDTYAVGLAYAIRADGVPLDVQRERLAALAQLAGGLGAETSAKELARHALLLDALFDLLCTGVGSAVRSGPANAHAAEKLASGAIKVQRAAVAVLSALSVLRQQGGTLGASNPVNDTNDHADHEAPYPAENANQTGAVK